MPEKQEVQEWYGRNARVMHSDSEDRKSTRLNSSH